MTDWPLYEDYGKSLDSLDPRRLMTWGILVNLLVVAVDVAVMFRPGIQVVQCETIFANAFMAVSVRWQQIQQPVRR